MRARFSILLVAALLLPAGCKKSAPSEATTASAAAPTATASGSAAPTAPASPVDPHLKEGKVKFALGDYKGCLDAMQQVLAKDPGNAEAKKYAARAQAEIDKLTAATPSAPPTAAPTPSEADRAKSIATLLKEADALVKEEKFAQPPGENALEKYLAVLEKEPLNRQARTGIVSAVQACKRIGREHLDKQSPMKALEYFAQAQLMSPRDAETLDLIARAQGMAPGATPTTGTAVAEATPAPTAPPAPVESKMTPPPSTPPAMATIAPGTPAPPTPTPTAPATPSPSPSPTPSPAPAPTQPSPTPPPATPAPLPSMDGDRPPFVTSKVQAVYPRSAWDKGLEGVTELKVLVSLDGTVSDVQVQQSSGYVDLDQAAVDAVRGYKFLPALEGGRPVPQWGAITITFKKK